MKTVLFCGGLGSRMREYSAEIPKPLVPIHGRPVICHVMDYYTRNGHNSFILCLGYKGEKIREYFSPANCPEVRSGEWDVTLVDTGENATIGDRLLAVAPLLAGEELFMANYSDGLSDFPLAGLIDRVRGSGAVAGFLSVVPNHSFHFVHTRSDGLVLGVHTADTAGFRINGGFFVLRPEIFANIGPQEELVEAPFARLIARQQLMAMPYNGFWRCVDTLKDLKVLESWLDDEARQGKVYLARRQPANNSAVGVAL